MITTLPTSLIPGVVFNVEMLPRHAGTGRPPA